MLTRLAVSLLLLSAVLAGLDRASAQVSFATPVDYRFGLSAHRVAVGDVNGDQQPDLVVLDASSINPLVFVLINRGKGVFSSLGIPSYSAGIGVRPRSLVLADLDGDSHLDVLTCNDATNDLSFLPNDGQGRFPSASLIPVAEPCRALTAADLDGDGDLDIAATARATNRVITVINLGGGKFQKLQTFSPGTKPRKVIAVDLDRDGDQDLVVASETSGDLWTALNGGTGRFSPQPNLLLPSSPLWVAAADLDRDGDLDVVTPNRTANTVTVLRNNGAGTLTTLATSPSTGNDPQTLAAVDLNGDGVPDLVTSNELSDDVSVLINNGQAVFASQLVKLTSLSRPNAVAVGDLDGDGDQDIVTANLGSASPGVTVILNTTSGAAAGARVTLGGLPNIGTTVAIQLTSPDDPARPYIAGFSTASTPGIPFPASRTIPLAPSNLLFFSLVPNPIFLNTQSTLGSSGTAYARFAIPNVGVLRNQWVFTAFVVYNVAGAPAGIRTISPALGILIQ